MNCLVFGRGPWGRNIARTLNELGHKATVVSRGASFSFADAAFIATPVSTHRELVAQMFKNGVPVFCEKPMVMGIAEAVFLRDAWERNNKPVFLVDHLQLFNEDVEHTTPIGHFHIDAYGPGPYRPDCSGLWDWGSHTVAEALFLTSAKEGRLVKATSAGPVINDNGISEMVDIQATFDGTFITMRVGNGATVKRHASEHIFDAAFVNEPPLTRAVKAFLDEVREPSPGDGDRRFGMDLPFEVCRFLESVDDELMRQGIERPQRAGS